MTRDLEYNITAQDNGVTISDYLKKQGFSHAVIVQLKKIPESILLNGKWEYMSTRLNDGDCLFIHFEETEGSENIVATNLPLSICYEDEDILVVNKPADMPIHPSMNNYDNTLANAVCHYYQTQGIPYTFRCVNRLDRDTTGLTILAKHLISSAILNSEVSVRGISREYLAIVKGFTEDEGTVNAPIGRKEGSTIERQIDELYGETAITHYKTYMVSIIIILVITLSRLPDQVRLYHLSRIIIPIKRSHRTIRPHRQCLTKIRYIIISRRWRRINIDITRIIQTISAYCSIFSILTRWQAFRYIFLYCHISC